MRRRFLTLGWSVFGWSVLAAAPAAASDWPYERPPDSHSLLFYDWPASGLRIVSRPGQRSCSVGGFFFPRKTTVTETDGRVPITTTFVSPSAFHSPTLWTYPSYGRGTVEVQVPDPRGLLYVNGSATPLRGPAQLLKTPLLETGSVHVYRLRAAFRSGDKLLIQDKTVSVHAGQAVACTFDGTHAVAVRLPSAQPKTDGVETAPAPRRLPSR